MEADPETGEEACVEEAHESRGNVCDCCDALAAEKHVDEDECTADGEDCVCEGGCNVSCDEENCCDKKAHFPGGRVAFGQNHTVVLGLAAKEAEEHHNEEREAAAENDGSDGAAKDDACEDTDLDFAEFFGLGRRRVRKVGRERRGGNDDRVNTTVLRWSKMGGAVAEEG